MIPAAADLGSKRARRPSKKTLAKLAPIEHNEIKGGYQHSHNKQGHVIPAQCEKNQNGKEWRDSRYQCVFVSQDIQQWSREDYNDG
jgi:hypothetical protein